MYSIMCCFQRKEFVGQKSQSSDEDAAMYGETITELLDMIWNRASPSIKREVIVSDESIQWSDNVAPTREEFGKFIHFQDPVARKTYTIDQFNSTLLSRLRHKRVNAMVHVYGRQLCNKTVHGQFVAKLLKPEQRDRANADNTQSLMALVEVLKLKHSSYLTANASIWQMWANAIQSSPPHTQEELLDKFPPAHLMHLFTRAPTSEAEILGNVQQGLLVADNLHDTYGGHLAMTRKDFDKFRQDMIRGLDFIEIRLSAMEEVMNSNRRLVQAMTSSVMPCPNVVSAQEEVLITDIEDLDHN